MNRVSEVVKDRIRAAGLSTVERPDWPHVEIHCSCGLLWKTQVNGPVVVAAISHAKKCQTARTIAAPAPCCEAHGSGTVTENEPCGSPLETKPRKEGSMDYETRGEAAPWKGGADDGS